MDEPAQEGPRGQDHGAGGDIAAIRQLDPTDPAIFQNEVVRLGLDHLEAGYPLQLRLHRGGIERPIGLGPRPAHRRALAAVQNPKLDAPGVRHPAHEAVQGIDLAHQMAFAQAADGGIAGHGADGGKAVGDERRPRAHAGGRGRGFTAGVAAADHDDVEGRAHSGPRIGALYRNSGPRQSKTGRVFHVKLIPGLGSAKRSPAQVSGAGQTVPESTAAFTSRCRNRGK